MDFQGIISELRRRNVFRVATAYAIAGWLIIQICTATFPYLKLPEWLITAVIIFVLIGFPLSIIFAWAFELTPEGLKKSKEVEITASVTDRTGKKLNGIIITVLSMAVIFLLVERVFFAEATFIENQSELTDVKTASIAVLPFVNMSGDQDNEYFSDGLSEELLNALAKVEGMKVAGRTSSFKFKGQNENLTAIGQELGVGHVLEGSVRKSGNRVRITAQLIKVDDGYHVWSETYDRELTTQNIFGIQEEISKRVLNQLKVRLLPEAEVKLADIPTMDVEAYNIYLKGTQYEASRIEKDLELAIQQYKEAVRLDPTFAKAYGRMAIAYELLYGYGDLSNSERQRLVRENVDQALFLDDDIPEAYAALGLMYNSNGELQKGIAALEKALELNSNYGIAYTWLGNLYSLKDREKAVINYRKAYEIDPLNNVVHQNYIRALTFEDRYDEALDIYKARIKVEPKFLFTYYRVAEIHAFNMGEIEKAFEYLMTAKSIDEDASITLAYLGILSQSAGLSEYSKKILKEQKEKYPESEGTKVVESWNLYFDREYVQWLDFIENDFMKGVGQESIPDPEIASTFIAAKKENRLDLIDTIIDEIYPELKEEEILLNQDNVMKAIYWAKSLKIREEQEPYDALVKAICKFGESEKKKIRKNENSDDYIYPLLFCADFNEDEETFLTLFKEYENLVNPLLIFFDLVENDPIWELSEQPIPQIENAKKKALEHLNSEYKKTVELLRANGEWDESWSDKPVLKGYKK